MPERSGRVQHYRWTLGPTVIVHSLPLGLVQGHDQVLLGCEEKGPCDPESSTSRTIGIGIDWRYPPCSPKVSVWGLLPRTLMWSRDVGL